ncbi:MAG: hypothetical protein MK102_09885 [Fuerstiella sp.]|nr:hypothetical protein [Fuerstiella sp.]
MILSDTATCPECGYAFATDAASAGTKSLERGATVHEVCQNCGDEVPTGLVRCWTCNGFMREDIAKKYQDLVNNPQKIIFSDLPPGERTETIPPRPARGGYARILDVEDEFTLQNEESGSGADFELQTASSVSQPNRPSGTSAKDTPVPKAKPNPPPSQSTPVSETETPPALDASEDVLLSIALTQEKEAILRKRHRRAAMNRKRILIPCPSCGVWLRVREEQSGKTVRCRSCQSAVPVPQIRKKKKKAPKTEPAKINLDWLEDIHVHLIVPTEVTLKHGILQDQFQTADAAFDDDGLHLITLGAPPKKKSLFSRHSTDDVSEKRTQIREHIQNTGDFDSIPHGQVHTVPISAMSSIRLVQPVQLAHESMFAGVPVFGDGRIVIYLPLKLEDERQAFCSMTLTLWRKAAAHFEAAGIDLPARANGVPESDVHNSPMCHYSQQKLDSIRDVAYYKNDSAFELELTGYRCANCAIAVSESARAKNKLGGTNGKTVAKAKCPSCSKKFGNEPMFRITKSPASASSESDTSDSLPDIEPGAENKSEPTESTTPIPGSE